MVGVGLISSPTTNETGNASKNAGNAPNFEDNIKVDRLYHFQLNAVKTAKNSL